MLWVVALIILEGIVGFFIVASGVHGDAGIFEAGVSYVLIAWILTPVAWVRLMRRTTILRRVGAGVALLLVLPLVWVPPGRRLFAWAWSRHDEVIATQARVLKVTDDPIVSPRGHVIGLRVTVRFLLPTWDYARPFEPEMMTPEGKYLRRFLGRQPDAGIRKRGEHSVTGDFYAPIVETAYVGNTPYPCVVSDPDWADRGCVRSRDTESSQWKRSRLTVSIGTDDVQFTQGVYSLAELCEGALLDLPHCDAR